MLNRFVINDEVGTLVDQLDELSTIHFSDSVDFFELCGFLNRQERRIDKYKSYVNDPFEQVNESLQKYLGCNFEEFVAKHHVVFTEFEHSVDLHRDVQYYYTTDSVIPTAVVPKRMTGHIVLKGSFLM